MNPFDMKILAPAKKPTTDDINQGFSAERGALSFFYEQLLRGRLNAGTDVGGLQTGFIGEGFKVRPTSPASMTVTVTAGLGWFYDPTDPLVIAQDITGLRYQGTNDASPFRPLVLGQAVELTVPAAPAVGNSRYDIIEVRPKREVANYGPEIRYDSGVNDWRPLGGGTFLRYSSDQTEVGSVVTPVLSTAPVSYVKGVEAPTGTQVEPPTTPGYVRIARILVAEGVTSVDSDVICNRRSLVFPNGVGFVAGRGTMRSERGQKVRPSLTHVVAPPGVQVFLFNRDTVPLVSGFPIALNIGVLTGAPLKFFTGGSELVNPIDSMTPDPDNEHPIIAHGASVSMNRTLSISFISNTEMANPLFASPAGLYAEGEYYSVMRPFVCGWSGTNWDMDMSTQDPIEFSFWMALSY